MQLIEKQFGQKFADMVAASPTLLDDLAKIRRRGIKIRRIKGRKGYSYKPLKKIYIGRGWSTVMQIECLAHEAYHVLYGDSPETMRRKMSRSAFLRESLAEETDSVIHELKVAEELVDAGYTIDRCTRQWLRMYRRRGRSWVRKMLAEATTSVGNETYREYFERQYDEFAERSRTRRR